MNYIIAQEIPTCIHSSQTFKGKRLKEEGRKICVLHMKTMVVCRYIPGAMCKKETAFIHSIPHHVIEPLKE